MIQNDTEFPSGIEYIHDSILQPLEQPLWWKLIQDTTPGEHDALSSLATEVRNPTQDEFDFYGANILIPEPDPTYDRACELLATSTPVITMPEMWELARIFGARLGYRFD